MMIQKMHKFILVILCLLLMHNHNAIAGQDGSMTFIGKVAASSSDDTTSNAIVCVDGDYEIQETESISSQYLPITCMHSQSELYFYSIVETTDDYQSINIHKYYDGDMHSVFENISISAKSSPLLIDKDFARRYSIESIVDFETEGVCLVEEDKLDAETFRDDQADRIETVEVRLGEECYSIPLNNDHLYCSGIPCQNCPIGVNRSNDSFFTLLPLSEKERYSISLFVQEEESTIASPMEIRLPLHEIWNLCLIDIEYGICETYLCEGLEISLVDLMPISEYMIYNEDRNSFIVMCRSFNPIEAFYNDIWLYDRIVLVEIGLTSGTVDIIYESGYTTPDYQSLIPYIWKIYGVCYANGWTFTTLSEEEANEFHSLQTQAPIMHDTQEEIELSDRLFAVWN